MKILNETMSIYKPRINNFDDVSQKSDSIIDEIDNKQTIEPLLKSQKEMIHISDVIDKLMDIGNKLGNISNVLDNIINNDNYINTKKETIGFEILDLAVLTKTAVEYASPFDGEIKVLKVQGREELVKIELYLGGTKMFPYVGAGYFPSSMETFETSIKVKSQQIIRVEFTNQDDTNTHTCQMYTTIHKSIE